MGTVSKDIADKIIAGKGHYADDPPVIQIIEYTNMAGALAYGLEYERDIGKYQPSPFVINPKVIFKYNGGK